MGSILAPIDDDHLVLRLEEVAGALQCSTQLSRAEALADLMRAWGFAAVHLQHVRPDKANVVALLRGSDTGPRLMLVGHLDGGGPVRPATDEVGVLAVMALVAAALQRASTSLAGDLAVTGSVGLLEGGVGTQHLLATGPNPDAAIILSRTDGRIVTEHPGIVQLILTTIGQSAWVGAQHRRRYVNAIYQMREAMARLGARAEPPRSQSSPQGLATTITPRGILGGFTKDFLLTRPAQHADFCSALIEVAYSFGLDHNDVITRVAQALTPLEADPDFRYTVQLPPATCEAPWHGQMQPLPPTRIESDHRLVQAVTTAYREATGHDNQELPVSRPVGWSDSGYFHAAGVPCLDYGPGAATRAAAADPERLLVMARVLALAATKVLGLPQDL